MNASKFGPKKDQFFMQKALDQAAKAYEKDEVPIGAVVVNAEGTIVARGHNFVEARHTQLAHAEIIALQKAAKKLGDWRLDGYWIYVTLQPCSMCKGLIELSRLAGLVYGADSPLFGYQLDNNSDSRLYKKNALTVIKGVGADQSVSLLRHFFTIKREKA